MFALAAGCSGDDSGDDTGAGTTAPTGGTTAPSTDDGSPQTDGPEGTDTGPDGNTTSASSDGPDDTTGAGSAGDSETGRASACDAAIVASISGNHGHALEVPLADIEAGVEVTYDASGDAGHCHEVVLTAEDFATLREGGAVTKYSCNGGDHQFVLSCAAGAPDPVAPPECSDGDNTGQCG